MSDHKYTSKSAWVCNRCGKFVGWVGNKKIDHHCTASDETYEIRVTRLAVAPSKDGTLYDERTTLVEIDDEAGGEFVTVRQTLPSRNGVAFDPCEWPLIREAIDRMVSACRTKEEQ
jgi:hypothetical protein